MKKIIVLATAAFLVTGMAFAHEGDGKKCGKGKDCCKDMKKDSKATAKTTAKVKAKS